MKRDNPNLSTIAQMRSGNDVTEHANAERSDGGTERITMKTKTRKRRSLTRAALNPREAKCCCACAHWHKGQCRNPKMRHGVTYKDQNTGEETHIEWWTTGCYHSCLNWTDASTPNTELTDAESARHPVQ